MTNRPIRVAPNTSVSGPVLISTPDWMGQAACLVPLPPADATPAERAAYAEALNAGFPHTEAQAWDFIHDNCRRCWTQSECYEFAIKNDVKHGVWGGQLIGLDDGDGLGT